MCRLVDRCEFRESVDRASGIETAHCRLALRTFGPTPPIARAVCESCCTAEAPGHERLNHVVASIVYRAASRAREGGDASTSSAAQRTMDDARDRLEVMWSSPNRPGWTGPVHGPRTIAELTDSVVNPDTFVERLDRDEPFAYLRYGDGEWLSILGQHGRNCDGHDFFPQTMGGELRATLAYAASLGVRGAHYYMGLHTTWHQDAIRRYLVEHMLTRQIHWVPDQLFVEHIADLSTLRFLEAVRSYKGLKVLAGNESLAPVAEGLRCRHVVVPRADCYAEINRLVEECAFSGPGLFIACAGPTAECLIGRLHRANPRGSFVDCGSLFDALTGNRSRDYTRSNRGGVLDLLHGRYAPVVLGSSAGIDGP